MKVSLTAIIKKKSKLLAYQINMGDETINPEVTLEEFINTSLSEISEAID